MFFKILDKTYQIKRKRRNLMKDYLQECVQKLSLSVIDETVDAEPKVEASQEEIKTGDAYFLTVLKNNEIKKCKIRIDQIIKQDQPAEKGIHFTLIDQDVIDLTNGIVQGMSGSPIIQNNKLIGCITHASSQNNLQGYGMFIQWMINNS